MFGRLLAIRLRNAEEALAAGRLEEAMQALFAGGLTDNARVQNLREELAGRFLERGQEKMMSRRFAEAMADFECAAGCAAQGGPNAPHKHGAADDPGVPNAPGAGGLRDADRIGAIGGAGILGGAGAAGRAGVAGEAGAAGRGTVPDGVGVPGGPGKRTAAGAGEQIERINDWKRRARQALEDHEKAASDRQVALAVARERLAAGRLDEASRALASLPKGDDAADRLRAAVDQQSEKAAAALAEAVAHFKAERLGPAIDRLHTGQVLHAGLPGIADLQSKIVDQVFKEAGDAFREGRLDRAERQLAMLGDLGRTRPQRQDLEEALRLASEAARALSNDRYARAGVLLGRLAQLGLSGSWINDVRKHLQALDSARRALLEGPLGLLCGREVPGAVTMTPLGETQTGAGTGLRHGMAPPAVGPRRAGRPAEAAGEAAGLGAAGGKGAIGGRAAAGIGPGRHAAARLPSRLLLRVDGVGSFLLLRSDRIAVGRAGPGASADLQLISDLSERHAEIIRAGEDYFVISSSGVELAGKVVDHALLADGDRLRLGSRLRLKFLRPSKKSAAAVLDLGDGVRTTSDCRRVILWSGPLLMGATKECHVRLAPSQPSLILLERDGGLLLKRMGAGGDAVAVRLGADVEIGELRLRVQEAANDADETSG